MTPPNLPSRGEETEKTSKQLPFPKLPRWVWWGILGLAFIAVFGASTQALFQQWRANIRTDFPVHEDPLAGWKTYRNEQYGFELRYPSDWTISYETQPVLIQKNTPVNSVILSEKDTSWKGFYSVQVFNKENLSLDQWINKYQPRDQNGKSSIGIVSDTTLGGSCAKYFEIEGFVSNYDTILADKNNYFFYVVRILPDVDYDRTLHKEVTNQILSTFKFIEPVKQSNLFKNCPEEWIVNKMPGPDVDDPAREYFIYQGVRRELSEFDVEWVKRIAG